MSIDTNPRASSRSIYDVSGGWSPEVSNFNVEWCGVLRSERHAPCRVRVRELRGRTRNQASASKWSMDHMVGHVVETIELKAREAWLGLHKTALKTRRAFK